MRIIVIFIFLFFTVGVFAQVKINEFTVEPDQSAEIINLGTENVNISGWMIDDNGGTTFYTIPDGSNLLPNSCLVFTGSFNLNKSSADTIKLLNGVTLVDSFTYPTSPGQNVSFARIPDGDDNWATAAASLGNFNSTQQSCVVIPSPTPTVTPAITGTNSPSPTPVIYDNIFISEVMVQPLSGEKEWIEIYNANDFEVKLVGWYVDDVADGGGPPLKFDLTIPARSYKVFDLTTSLFNNSEDSARLLDPSKVEKDGFEYLSSEKNISWGRSGFDSKDFCLQEPSKELSNNSCLIDVDDEDRTTASSNATISPPTRNTPRPISYQRPVQLNNLDSQVQGEILGEYTIDETVENNSLSKLLSSLSLSYSSLTIVSILLKIKFNA